jgi:prophage antirepressor-like protein
MEIQTFSKKKFGQMRGYADNGTVYLNVADIAVGLGFVNKDGGIRLKKINQLLKKFHYPAGVSENDYIPENLFYRLAMKADNPNADKFQGWLADEVVPSIRRTGSYSLECDDVKTLPSPEVRQNVINTTNSFKAVTQNYIYYAYNQGDRRGKDSTFAGYTKFMFAKLMSLANRVANIQNGCRDNSGVEKQFRLKITETYFREILVRGMYEGKHFAQIESELDIKSTELEKIFSNLSMSPQNNELCSLPRLI